MSQTTTSSRLRPFKPTAFGRYTLLLPISTGGMGEIFLARMDGGRGFDKLCVIKRILPHLAQDRDFVSRFVNEAKTLAQLSHGSIAQILDFGMVDGTPFLAIEWVDGKDLRRISARMRDRNLPMPLTFVLFVMSRVLDALAYAHRKRDEDENEIGLVHRDVSPQNILISYEGEVKVIDFGLAKSTLNENRTNPSIVLGKFLYMSPEQARHQNVDRRSDLYAVGLCLYELIAGKNPFDDIPPGELMAKVASPAIRPLSHTEPLTPPAVAQVVMRALSPDPAHRFQTAEEFRGRLMACLLDIDSSAGPESASRFMRDAFGGEHQAEKKLHASLRDALKPLEPEPDTAVHPKPPPPGRPALEPVAPRRDVSPLSFKPTPTARAQNTDFSDRDRETMPGVVTPEGINRYGEAETAQVGVVADPELRSAAPPPPPLAPPVPDRALPMARPSAPIVQGKVVEPTEPSALGLHASDHRRPSGARAAVRPDPAMINDSTDPSLAPVSPVPPGLKRQEVTKPIAAPSLAVLTAPVPAVTPAPMPAATPIDTLPPSGEQSVVVTPMEPLMVPGETLQDVGPLLKPGPEPRTARAPPEARSAPPVVEKVPRALEKVGPAPGIDTQRTRTSRPVLLLVLLMLSAVLASAGYIFYDMWKEQQLYGEPEKERVQAKPVLDAPVKRREPEPPAPPPDEPEKPPEKAATADDELAPLTDKPAAVDKPKPAPAPASKKQRAARASAASRALGELRGALKEFGDAGGNPSKFGLRVKIIEDEMSAKMGESEEAVFVQKCEKLEAEIDRAKEALEH